MYIGVSAANFDQLVADGRMPAARRIDGRKVWDVRELDLVAPLPMCPGTCSSLRAGVLPAIADDAVFSGSRRGVILTPKGRTANE
jgi:hypothetical protein